MNAQRSPLEVKNLTMMELSHFRLAAVEQPPARFARRPPDSGGLKRFEPERAFQTRLCKIPINNRRPSGRYLPAPRNLEADEKGACPREANPEYRNGHKPSYLTKEKIHFRHAAVEQPPARFARRPPDSGGLKRFDIYGHFKLA